MVLASRSGNIGSIWHAEFGFLLLNETGDLPESNWVPDSGTFVYSYDGHIPIVQDADGFSILKKDFNTFYRFDAMGHFLWSKITYRSFTPLAMHQTSTGYVICGFEYTSVGNELLNVATLDLEGNLLWSRVHNIKKLEFWYDVAVLPEGGYLAVGSLGNPDVDYNADFFAAKINTDGSIFNNVVSGYVFADLNGNCLRDSAELGFASLNTYFNNSYFPYTAQTEPLGRGELHYIPADTALIYLIRFQNTGNDTAFTVIIRDTLSADLDPFSVRTKIASHLYRLEFQEDGSLKFVFEHILLPDSTANEAASHGFIRCRVNMRPDLLPLTTISNRAATYFDYNTPVLTNTVQRTIEPVGVYFIEISSPHMKIVRKLARQ